MNNSLKSLINDLPITAPAMVVKSLCMSLFVPILIGAQLTSVQSQEVGGAENIPALERLELSQENLNQATNFIISTWDANFQAPASEEKFDKFYKILTNFGRIEGTKSALEISGLANQSPVYQNLKDALQNLTDAEISKNEIAKLLLDTILALPSESPYFGANFKEFKVRYPLILNSVNSEIGATYALDLSQKLLNVGLSDESLRVYGDFIPRTFQAISGDDEKAIYLTKVAELASVSGEPEYLQAITDIYLEISPLQKSIMATAIGAGLSDEYLQKVVDLGVMPKAIAQAWLGNVQDSATEADILAAVQDANSTAFEIALANISNQGSRQDVLSRAIIKEVELGYTLSAMRKLHTFALDFDSYSDTYLRVLVELSSLGYTNYVNSFAQEIIVKAKGEKLATGALSAANILNSLEGYASNDIIKNFGILLGLSEKQVDWRVQRNTIFLALHKSPLEPFHEFSLSLEGTNKTASLVAAIDILDQEISSIEAISTDLIDDPESIAEDNELLEGISARAWSSEQGRQVILQLVSNELPLLTKAAIALGVTANPTFYSNYPESMLFKSEIKKIISELDNGKVALPLQASIDLLGRDIEIVAEDELLKQILSRQFLSFAAAGKSMGVESAIASLNNVFLIEFLVAEAIYGDFILASRELKKAPDYKKRIAAFRRIAVARAEILDTASILNTSIPYEDGSRVNSETRDEAQLDSDGFMDLYNQKKIKTLSDPYMPNMLVGSYLVENVIPYIKERSSNEAVAVLSKRASSRDIRLTRFSSENYEGTINLGVRDTFFLAQNSSVPEILYVASGTMTIGELISQIQLKHPNAISVDGRTVTLKRPLVINSEAALIVSGGEIDELRLSTDDGVFIIASGDVYFDDVRVVAYDLSEDKPSIIKDAKNGKYFRPFILGWSGSEIYASDSQFLGLGYSAGRAYGMSFSAGPFDDIGKLQHGLEPTGYLINNSFDNLYYGYYAYEARDVILVGNELRDGVIYGIDPHDRSENLMMAYNTSYDTQKKHGIIISRDVDNSWIVGNLSFDNKGSGIMLDRLSYGTVIYANHTTENAGDGIAVLESPCAFISHNDVSRNGRTGIKVRNSWDVHVSNNLIRENKASGIESYIDRLEDAPESAFRNFVIDAYYPITTIAAFDNYISKNAIGISSRGSSEVIVHNNRFVQQLPRYMGGDLKAMGLKVLANSGKAPIAYRSRCVPDVPDLRVCKLAINNVIHSQSSQMSQSAEIDNRCVSNEDTVQFTAFERLNVRAGNE